MDVGAISGDEDGAEKSGMSSQEFYCESHRSSHTEILSIVR